jgi:hypothetical protein
MVAFMARIESRSSTRNKRARPSTIAVRQHLSPVDVYCYLRARFGEPNGFQNFLRTDDSDNWIHWDFNLMAADEDVYVCGTSREVHIAIWEHLTDENWRDLILQIKADYGRVGKEKSAVLKSLERWVTFQNKFVEVANICADLHGEITDNMGGYQKYRMPSLTTKKANREQSKILKGLTERSSRLYKHCIELSLLTPILAETFINMIILILCKPEIRGNGRQFDAFIRSPIDTKIFDLFYKCTGFARPIDQHSETFKNFKRVMDKRNNTIHGNCDPEKEAIELVYFEQKRPLYAEPGDHIGKFFDALERLHEPGTVIKDYEDTHMFLADILGRLEPGLSSDVLRIMEDPYPGYDTGRKILGCLFSDSIFVASAQGVRYDDELAVSWS